MGRRAVVIAAVGVATAVVVIAGVLAVAVVVAVHNSSHNVTVDSFTARPDPQGDFCSYVKYVTTERELQLVTQDGDKAYTFANIDATQMAKLAPADLAGPVADYKAAFDAWPTDHSSVTQPKAHAAAVAIDAYAAAHCPVS